MSNFDGGDVYMGGFYNGLSDAQTMRRHDLNQTERLLVEVTNDLRASEAKVAKLEAEIAAIRSLTPYSNTSVKTAPKKSVKGSKTHMTRSRTIKVAQGVNVCVKVFATAELAEYIFLHLEIKDVMRLQVLSTFFRNLVKGSLKIQRKVFLLPSNEPILLRHGPPYVKHWMFPETERDSRIALTNERVLRKLNTAVLFRPKDRDVAEQLLWCTEITELSESAKKSPRSSCWKMQLTDPPSTSVTIWLGTAGHYKITRDNGVTYGDVVSEYMHRLNEAMQMPPGSFEPLKAACVDFERTLFPSPEEWKQMMETPGLLMEEEQRR